MVATFNDDDGGGGGDNDDDNDGDGGEDDSGVYLRPRLPHRGCKETRQLLGHGVAKNNRGLETFKESKPSPPRPP